MTIPLIVLVVCFIASPACASLIEFRTATVEDPLGPISPVAVILVPTAWTRTASLAWRSLSGELRPALCLELVAPDTSAEMRFHPPESFLWTYGTVGESVSPGACCPRREPMGALSFLKEVFIPEHRSYGWGLRVLRAFPLRDLPPVRQHAPGLGAITTVDGAGIEVTYAIRGRAVTEELYAILRYQSYQVPSLWGPATEVFWTAEPIVSVRWNREPSGVLLGVMQTVAHSLQLNPAWYEAYWGAMAKVAMGEVPEPRSERELRLLLRRLPPAAATDQPVTALPEQSLYDVIASALSVGRPRTSAYQDPASGTLTELPAGFAEAWTDGHGTYRLADVHLSLDDVSPRERWYLLQPRQ